MGSLRRRDDNSRSKVLNVRRDSSADEQPDNRIFLIPVRLEECDVPDQLKKWQWVDLFKPTGFDRLFKALQTRGVVGASQPSFNLRLTVHRALFLPEGPECYFINATNIGSYGEIEVTHVWFETAPPVYVIQPDRPLPKRLKPQETWETWLRVDSLDSRQDVFVLARARLSTGIVVSSLKNVDVPLYGSVPGGPISQP